MMDERLAAVTGFLRSYDGPAVRLMEVCGTHTGAIASLGLRSILSPKIELLSGPGCPVCVTVSDYVDRLCTLARTPGYLVATFGDMLRVPGSRGSLQDAMAAGGRVAMLYSPFELLERAAAAPDTVHIFAAVGFETTTPLYALLLEEAQQRGITNIRLLTSLKTMPPAIRWICAQSPQIDGFLAPGHVGVITGSGAFDALAQESGLPFAVAGFDAPQLLAAIYTLVRRRGHGEVYNLYRSAVQQAENERAAALVKQYFEPGDAAWRGLGTIPGSGLYLRREYAAFDAGSRGLDGDVGAAEGCICGSILTGRAVPTDCPLFRSGVCAPEHPKGACMVSTEGCCNCWKRSGIQR